MWECPDFFEINGQGLFIFSPMGIEKGNQAICTLADFNETNCSINIHENIQYFDYGLDLYAPQSTTDAEGRRTIIAWLRMSDTMENNTIGMMCIPRVCEVKNHHIYFYPHPNIRSKFTKKTDVPQSCYMFRTNIENDEEINISGYIIGRKNGKIYADRSAVINDHKDMQNRFETPLVSGYNIEVYIEYGMKNFSSDELAVMLKFADAGAAIVTTRKGTLKVMPAPEEVDNIKQFVSKIMQYDCNFDIVANRYIVDAKSIMGIFRLDLS